MTTRDRLIIVVVLVAAALGGFWFLGLAPKRKAAADLQGQIVSAQQKLADAQQMAAQARKAKASYDDDYAAVASAGQGRAQERRPAVAALPAAERRARRSHRLPLAQVWHRRGAARPTAAATPAANAAHHEQRQPGRIDGARRRRRRPHPPRRRRPPRCLRAPASARRASRPCRSPSSSPAPTSTWSASCTTSRASSASTGRDRRHRAPAQRRRLLADRGSRRLPQRQGQHHRHGLRPVAQRRDVDHDARRGDHRRHDLAGHDADEARDRLGGGE